MQTWRWYGSISVFLLCLSLSKLAFSHEPLKKMLEGSYSTEGTQRRRLLVQEMTPRYVVSGLTNWEYYDSFGFLINHQNAEFSADVRMELDVDGFPVFKGVGSLVLNRSGLICSLPYRIEVRAYLQEDNRQYLMIVDESSRVVRSRSAGLPCTYDGVTRRAQKDRFYYAPLAAFGAGIDLQLEDGSRLVLNRRQGVFPRIWLAALKECKDAGGDLASIEDIQLGYQRLFTHPSLTMQFEGTYFWTREEVGEDQALAFSLRDPNEPAHFPKSSKLHGVCSKRY